jgi:hypothetical protein
VQWQELCRFACHIVVMVCPTFQWPYLSEHAECRVTILLCEAVLWPGADLQLKKWSPNMSDAAPRGHWSDAGIGLMMGSRIFRLSATACVAGGMRWSCCLRERLRNGKLVFLFGD